MKLAKKNFLDIKTKNLKKKEVVIVPFGFETTTSYRQGTRRGPAAIIKASSQVELFDEELWQETCKKLNIVTLNEIKPAKSLLLAKKQTGKIVEGLLLSQKLPIILGGEHSITPFIVESYIRSSKKNFTILQFDAHTDLRDGYLGQKYSHAAAMRRCLDFRDINLVQVGIRSISNENNELIFWEKNQNRIKTFWAKDMKRWKINDIVDSLRQNVYLTFDLDVFDLSLMPSVGTPEPGGLDWYQTTEILRAVARKKKIIGADFVEFSPIKGFPAPDFLAAKLIYKTIGFVFAE